VNSTYNTNWYHLKNIQNIDSPALIIYKERVIQNINTAISMVDVKRLRPHVKTSKQKEAARLMMDAGIHKFKCATIAEAEMLAMINAPDVLLAYQPIGPKLQRFIILILKYPATKFSCLIDHYTSAKNIASSAEKNNIVINVFIDINIGMNRTGIAPDRAMELYNACKTINCIKVTGLHAYDGHLNNSDIAQRTLDCNDGFEQVIHLQHQLQQTGFEPIIIAGGSPTFPIHSKRKDVECSPGTFIYWDWYYAKSFAELHFVPAVLVIARIISLPSATTLCIDLGHKSIASENALNNRVFFFNAPDLIFTSHSEEHLVAEASSDHTFKPGDILYGIPFHVCPTVALYERAQVAENNTVTTEWKTIARDKKITV
jgi:D-serine deaminase-like pyridoxal phosphate-dependent protein